MYLKNQIIDLNQMHQRYHLYLLILKILMYLKMRKIHLKRMFLKLLMIPMYQKMPNFLKNPTYHFGHLNHKNLMNQLNLKLKLIHNIHYPQHQQPGIYLDLMLN
jgi:hypothetical protein